MRLGNRNPVHRLRHLLADHDLDAQPDAVLLARFAADRDEGAFSALVRRHSALVLGTARRVLGNPIDADDVFQAVFLTLSRKAGSIRCDGTLAPWLYRVTFRAAVRLRKRVPPARPVADRAEAGLDPLAGMSARELCSAIDGEVSRLSDRLRSVVLLCCFQGLTRDEAAAQLGWSSATVKRRLARARDLLDRRLRNRGVTLTAALAPALLTVTPPASAECVAGTVAVGLGRVVPANRVGTLCAEPAIPIRTWAAAVAVVGVLGVGLAFGLRPPQAPPQPADPPPTAKARTGEPAAELPPDPLPAGAVARIGTTRFRHDEWLSQAVWSPNGKYVASTAGSTLIVWEASSGRELGRLSLAAVTKPKLAIGRNAVLKYVRHLHWAKDGRTLFALFNGWSVRCSWDPAKGGLQFTQNYESTEPPLVTALSADGTRLFSASSHWASATDFNAGRIWPTAVPAGAAITDAIVSPTDELAVIAIAGDKAELQVFDMRWRQPVIAKFGRTVNRMTFSEDGKTFAAVVTEEGKTATIELWGTATWKSRLRFAYPNEGDRPAEVRALALSPDGKTLVTGANDKTLRWWDTTTGKETRREGPGWVYYNRAAFRPDGKVLMTVSHENHVRFWDVASGKQLPITDGPGWTIAAATFTDGRHVLSVSENVVYAHEAATGRELWRGAEHTDTAVQVAITPDGQTVITSGNEGRIIFRDAASGKVTRTIETARHAVDRIAVSPDGRTLAGIGGDAPDDAILRRWEIATGKAYPDAPLPPKGPKYIPSAIRYTPDGSGILIASGTESQVPVFDPETKQFRQVFGPVDGGVNAVDMTRDGRMVAAATMGPSIYFWEAATGKQRLMIKDVGYATCVALSPDGRILAVANDGLHSRSDGEKVVEHTDGRLIVRLLDTLTGREFHRYSGHTGAVYRLAWSADGTRLLSASKDASALVWDVSPAIRAKLPKAPLTDDDARKAVAVLGGTDAAAVYKDMARLAASPSTAVNAMRHLLRPVVLPDADQVAALVRDLDSPQFAVRERAAGQLAKQGQGVEGSLRKALDGNLSAEARDRVEKILAEVVPADQRLRQGRMLELLERIGEAEARRLLAEVAAGADGAWLTREAKAGLGRLTPPSR